jgi:hypothetical protein
MKNLLIAATLIVTGVSAEADVRVNIRLGAGHPLVRPGRTVIVRRAPVVVRTPLVYARPVVWARTVVALPPRNRMVWEDSETITRREQWVDTNFAVNNRGDALFFRVNGTVRIDFAEVTFGNGQVQVVDFNESPLNDGVYQLLNFADGREVLGVRMVMRSQAPRSTVTMLMRK